MGRVIVVLLLPLFMGFCSYAADTIIVHKDPRLDLLNTRQAAVNKLTSKMTSTGQYKGYRLQVLTTRSREEAFKLKTGLLRKFPDQKTYLVYQSPYFKVRIGNFANMEDAVNFKKQLSKVYPQPAYVVEDIIEFTQAEEEE